MELAGKKDGLWLTLPAGLPWMRRRKRLCLHQEQRDVWPCPFVEVSAGNVRQRPFHEIWRTGEVFVNLRNRERTLKAGAASAATGHMRRMQGKIHGLFRRLPRRGPLLLPEDAEEITRNVEIPEGCGA
jgi:hypothetical protein